MATRHDAGSGQGVFVGEYNARLDCFHVQRLSKTLESNLGRALRKDRSNGWVPIAIGDLESVGQVIEAVREGQARLLKVGAE